MPATIYDQNQTLEAFLAATAKRQPTPGGGSVAALVGALASATGEMVVNYSIGKKNLVAHEPKLKEIVAGMTRAREMMIELMIEDQAAFEALTNARRADDADRFAPALLACIRIPQSVAATAIAMLKLCDEAADIVNPQLASDLAICTELCMATVRCALYNVRVNLPDVPEESERRRLEQGNARTLSQATAMIQRVLPKIWARRDGD